MKLDLYLRQKAMLKRFQTPIHADRELNLTQASYAWRNPYPGDIYESSQQKDKAIIDKLFRGKK